MRPLINANTAPSHVRNARSYIEQIATIPKNHMKGLIPLKFLYKIVILIVSWNIIGVIIFQTFLMALMHQYGISANDTENIANININAM